MAERLVNSVKLQFPGPLLRLKESSFPLWDGTGVGIFPRHTRGGNPLFWKNQGLPLAAVLLAGAESFILSKARWHSLCL